MGHLLVQFFHLAVFLLNLLLIGGHVVFVAVAGLSAQVRLRFLNICHDFYYLLQARLNLEQAVQLMLVSADKGGQLAPVLLYFADLLNEFAGEHVHECDHLLPHSQQDVPNVVLPVTDRVGHLPVLIEDVLCVRLNLMELFQALLVTLVDEVDRVFVNQALDACVNLLLLLPKVEWEAMVDAVGPFFLANIATHSCTAQGLGLAHQGFVFLRTSVAALVELNTLFL